MLARHLLRRLIVPRQPLHLLSLPHLLPLLHRPSSRRLLTSSSPRRADDKPTSPLNAPKPPADLPDPSLPSQEIPTQPPPPPPIGEAPDPAGDAAETPTPPPPITDPQPQSSNVPEVEPNVKSLPSLDIAPSASSSLPPPPSTPSSAGEQRTGAQRTSSLSSIDRRRRMLGRIWALMSLVGAGVGVFYLGREWEAEERARGIATDAETWWGRVKSRGGNMLDYFNKPLWTELLPPPLPFPHGRPYTLVVDIDDLLVASTWDRQHGWRTAKRPGVDYFIAYLSQFYEIVVFTTQYVYSAQPVLESLDPFQAYIQYRLFRESTRMHQGKVVKDLSYLNRDLSRVIMLDTMPEHAALQPDNALILPKWHGEPGDKGLVGLIPFLESIAIHKVSDVRPILQKYAGKDVATEYAAIEAEQKRRAIEEWNAKHPHGSSGGVGHFTLSGIFGGQGGAPAPPKMPMSYLEQKRAEAQQIYREEQAYFAQHGPEMQRLIEEDKQRQLNEMKGSLFGYLGIGGGKKEEGKSGPGAAGAPVGAGSTGITPPVVGQAASAAGKSA